MKQTLIFLFLGMFFLGLSSCGGDKNNCAFGVGFALEINDELNALSEASVRYSNDPSTQNCEAYVDAYADYIDALRSLRGCYVAYGSLDDYNESLDEAERDLDDIDCQ